MAMITLQNSSDTGITVLTNNFIDNYMPEANGEFVKVYIYLLRLLSAASIPFSLEQMADHFFCTERDIVRALKYWEKEKLLTLTYRDNEEIADIVLHVPPVKTQAAAFQTPDSILSDPSVNTSDTNVTMEMAAQCFCIYPKISFRSDSGPCKRTEAERRDRTVTLHSRTVSRQDSDSYRDEKNPVLL